MEETVNIAWLKKYQGWGESSNAQCRGLMTSHVYYTKEGTRRQVLPLEIKENEHYYGDNYRAIREYKEGKIIENHELAPSSIVMAPAPISTSGTKPMWPARLLDAGEMNQRGQSEQGVGVVFLCYMSEDSNHCDHYYSNRVKSSDCRRVTVEELQKIVDCQQKYATPESRAKSSANSKPLTTSIGRLPHGAQVTSAWLAGMAYAIRFAELEGDSHRVSLYKPCENTNDVFRCTDEQLRDPWGDTIPVDYKVDRDRTCTVCPEGQCEVLLRGFWHFHKGAPLNLVTPLPGDKRPPAPTAGNGTKRPRKSNNSSSSSPMQPINLISGSSNNQSYSPDSNDGPNKENNSRLSHSRGREADDMAEGLTPSHDSKRARADTQSEMSFTELFLDLVGHVRKEDPSGDESIMCQQASILEQQLSDRAKNGSLTVKELELCHEIVLQALNECKAAIEVVRGKYMREFKSSLSDFKSWLNKERPSMPMKHDEREMDYFQRAELHLRQELGQKDPKQIEEELVEANANLSKIRADLATFQQQKWQWDGISSYMVELEKEAAEWRNKHEGLQHANQLWMQHDELKGKVNEVTRARVATRSYKTIEALLKKARLSWGSLRLKLYEGLQGPDLPRTLLLNDPDCMKHPGNCLENPERMKEVEQAFTAVNTDPHLYELQAKTGYGKYWPLYRESGEEVVYRAEVARVHSVEYLDNARLRCDNAGSDRTRLSAATDGSNEGDTFVGRDSFDAAGLGFVGALQAVDAVVEGKNKNAVVACRPPGHHAGCGGVPMGVNKPMGGGFGFCLLNHAAGAAMHAVEFHGMKRVTVVDIDLHHGNGTEEILCGRYSRSYQYISLHAYGEDVFPRTGSADTSRHPYVVNIPVDRVTAQAYKNHWTQISDAIYTFSPDLIVVSAGFDAHCNDPLGGRDGFNGGDLQAKDYYRIVKDLQRLADTLACGRMVTILEGGYCCALPPQIQGPLGKNDESLKDCIVQTCRAMARD